MSGISNIFDLSSASGLTSINSLEVYNLTVLEKTDTTLVTNTNGITNYAGITNTGGLITDTLDVTGSAYIQNLTVDTETVNTHVIGTLDVEGEASITNTLDVGGISTFTGALNANNIYILSAEVTNDVTAGSIVTTTMTNDNGITISSDETLVLTSYVSTNVSSTLAVALEAPTISATADNLNTVIAFTSNFAALTANVGVTTAQVTAQGNIVVTGPSIEFATDVFIAPALGLASTKKKDKKRKRVSFGDPIPNYVVDLSTNASALQSTSVDISSEYCLGLKAGSGDEDYVTGANLMMYKNFMDYLPIEFGVSSSTPLFFLAGTSSTDPSTLQMSSQSMVEYLNNAEIGSMINWGNGSGVSGGASSINLGSGAGVSGGAHNINIGSNCGNSTPAGSIVLNASSSSFNPTTQGLFSTSIQTRSGNTQTCLSYDPSTLEIYKTNVAPLPTAASTTTPLKFIGFSGTDYTDEYYTPQTLLNYLNNAEFTTSGITLGKSNALQINGGVTLGIGNGNSSTHGAVIGYGNLGGTNNAGSYTYIIGDSCCSTGAGNECVVIGNGNLDTGGSIPSQCIVLGFNAGSGLASYGISIGGNNNHTEATYTINLGYNITNPYANSFVVHPQSSAFTTSTSGVNGGVFITNINSRTGDFVNPISFDPTTMEWYYNNQIAFHNFNTGDKNIASFPMGSFTNGSSLTLPAGNTTWTVRVVMQTTTSIAGTNTYWGNFQLYDPSTSTTYQPAVNSTNNNYFSVVSDVSVGGFNPNVLLSWTDTINLSSTSVTTFTPQFFMQSNASGPQNLNYSLDFTSY